MLLIDHFASWTFLSFHNYCDCYYWYLYYPAIVYYMESTIIKNLQSDFHKAYIAFEQLDLIIRLTTMSRIIMNMIDRTRISTSEVIQNRMIYYAASFIAGIEDLKNITDTYGNIVAFSSEFQNKYGSISMVELNYGANYTDLSPKIVAFNFTFETAISKYVNKAILFSATMERILSNGTLSIDDRYEFERNFYFLIENGKKILRDSTEYAAEVITTHINTEFMSKKKVYTIIRSLLISIISTLWGSMLLWEYSYRLSLSYLLISL